MVPLSRKHRYKVTNRGVVDVSNLGSFASSAARWYEPYLSCIQFAIERTKREVQRAQEEEQGVCKSLLLFYVTIPNPKPNLSHL